MWAAPFVEELGVRTLCWCSGFRNNSEGGETKEKGREEWRGTGRENDTNSARCSEPISNIQLVERTLLQCGSVKNSIWPRRIGALLPDLFTLVGEQSQERKITPERRKPPRQQTASCLQDWALQISCLISSS